MLAADEQRPGQENIEALACAELPLQEIDALVSDLEPGEREKLVAILGQLVENHSDLLAHIKMLFPEFDSEGEGKDLYARAKRSFDSKGSFKRS